MVELRLCEDATSPLISMMIEEGKQKPDGEYLGLMKGLIYAIIHTVNLSLLGKKAPQV